MDRYQQIETICHESSRLGKTLIDDFLLYFCDAQEGLEKKILKKLAGFKKIIRKMPENWVPSLTSQFIAHRLFRETGLAQKYLRHPELKDRTKEELDYLAFQVKNPWRFVFCTIKAQVSGNFFEMRDVFSEEEFLLFSKSLTEITEKGRGNNLLFLLIGYNGHCWQTYGPFAYFRGIQPFDVFYFTKRLYPDTVFFNTVPALVQKDPVPYMMLYSGGEIPVTFHKRDMIVKNSSEYHVANFSPKALVENFVIEHKKAIYLLSLKGWSKFPHFAKCFYQQNRKRLILTAMTNLGYGKLVETLNKIGFQFPVQPDHRATPLMLLLIKDILKWEDDFSRLEKIFSPPPHSPGDQKQLDKMNNFLRYLTEAINNKTDFDLPLLAKKAGVDIKDAERIAKDVRQKFKNMPKF